MLQMLDVKKVQVHHIQLDSPQAPLRHLQDPLGMQSELLLAYLRAVQS